MSQERGRSGVVCGRVSARSHLWWPLVALSYRAIIAHIRGFASAISFTSFLVIASLKVVKSRTTSTKLPGPPDNATAALAKMNMILHNCPTAEIWQGNVLASPHFKQPNGTLKTFDFVVANPPFSFKAWSNGFSPAEDEFKRFAFGIPPAKNGDLAFLLHILACLKSTGKAAVNLPHGVLFRGNAEADIRREIVRRGYIKGIIGLPANLFYGTGIPACIVVLDKENAAARKGIFMIDASKGFIKDGNKNRLRAQDIHKIVDAFTRQIEIPRYSRMVPLAEIEANGFNLNLPRYIDSTEPEDLQDIDAHLRGGIPVRDLDALDAYWQVLPSMRAALFAAADRPGYSQIKVATGDIKATIFRHPEFTAFTHSVAALFDQWKTANIPRLKALIETLSEDLLDAFRAARRRGRRRSREPAGRLAQQCIQGQESETCHQRRAEGKGRTHRPGSRTGEAAA